MPDLFTRLGSALADRYHLERELGAGGMATVYLAHDLRHDRQVAIKVLHEDLGAALGPERFLAEIKTTARLQHPHILPLLDSGSTPATAQHGSLLFYVMPYVAGESLRQRLARETQLPIEDAVRIAREVADALESAHALGIVHRDIKPENILLRGGHALVADFGIALAVTQAGGARLTQSGLSVGTPTYMSPEQAAAEREVDHRADVYALGVVLYEMLAGQPPFTGATAAAITARKLTETVPPLRTVRETVPAALEQVVRKALARTPADRFSTAQRFADALDAAPTAARNHMDGTADLASVRPARWPPFLALAAMALLGAGLGGTVVWRHHAGAARDVPAIRFSVHPPPGDSIDFRSLMTINDWGLRNLAISPDGRRLAFVGVHANDTTSRLFLREMGGEETMPLAGTEGASAPFFSPDGEWVAYFSAQDGRLLKVPAKGGQPQIICDCGTSFGADWGTDGWIVLDPGGRRALTGLLKVRESGGRPESVPLAEGTFTSRGWQFSTPRFLPDGKTVLVTLFGGVAPRIVAISLLTGSITDIQDDAYMGQYLEGGYLLFAKTDELWAVRFDPGGLKKRGQPVRVADSVLASVGVWAEFAVSRSGTLVYHAPVRFGEGGNRLVWVDRDDRVEPIPGSPAGSWNSARLSPDGSRILLWGMPRVGSGHPRVWLFDRQSGARPITDDGYTSAWPIFAPDGRHVVSNSDREGAGKFPLFWAAIDGGEKPVRLTTTAVMNQPSSWTPDGKTLAFQQGVDPKTKYDLYTVAMTGDHAVKPLIVTKWNEREPAFSPDGRWLAYVSDESGRDEVYVRRYPSLDSPVTVSGDGGEGPAWAPDGREIFFARGTGIFAVPFRDGQPGRPLRLVDGRQRGSRNVLDGPATYGRNYDVSPDGRRFLMLQEVSSTPNGGEYHVVLNWFTELRARFAGAR